MRHKVIFLPDQKTVLVERGTTILAAALSAQIHLNSSCGGDGVCGKCKVIVKKGSANSGASDTFTPSQKEEGFHLACLTFVESDLEVVIPQETRLEETVSGAAVQDSKTKDLFFRTEDSVAFSPQGPASEVLLEPFVSKHFLTLSPPTFDDKLSDLERIYRALNEKIGETEFHSGLSNIRQLSRLLRTSSWKITAGITRKGPVAELVSIEPGDKTLANFGLVFDIGTTTITGQIVDLTQGVVKGTKVMLNRQAIFGSDVITRIIYAQVGDGLEKLHNVVIDAVNEMIEQFCAQYEIDLNDVECVCVAGNTTMTHLLLKMDPTCIRQEPYVPTANELPLIRAAEAGVKISPHGVLYCLPGVASYVGGDISAGVLACGMHQARELSLLIDIGTNGEIVLGGTDWLVGCAASAGPAFEGSGVRNGLRAVSGAIQKVTLNKTDSSFRLETIAGTKPRGICGSGYIDLLYALLKAGLLDRNGRLKTTDQDRRLRRGPDGMEFVVVEAADSGTGEDIVVTDTDIDNLKRAKGAIYSAIAILCRHLGIKVSDIQKIYIAGGFGTSLDIEHAVQVGLIPDLPRERFVFAGNTALAGARAVLMDFSKATVVSALARNMTYFELSADPGYMDEYMAALFFPHTRSDLFPSVTYIKTH